MQALVETGQNTGMSGTNQMPIDRYMLEIEALSTAFAVRGARTPLEIKAIESARDRAAVAALAESCRRQNGPSMQVSATGLAGELASRPGREVHGWLAWSTETIAGAEKTRDCPLGLVTLVASSPPSGGSARRFSIGWLVVHPEARRRGVAGALVNHAVQHARACGASAIFADTRADWPAAVAFWQALEGNREGKR